MCNMRLYTVLKAVYKLLGLGDMQCVPKLCPVGICAEGNIVFDIAGEHHGTLGHIAELFIELFKLIITHIHTVDQDCALGDIVKPRDEVNERRFARARGAYERHGLATVSGKAYIGQPLPPG